MICSSSPQPTSLPPNINFYSTSSVGTTANKFYDSCIPVATRRPPPAATTATLAPQPQPPTKPTTTDMIFLKMSSMLAGFGLGTDVRLANGSIAAHHNPPPPVTPHHHPFQPHQQQMNSSSHLLLHNHHNSMDQSEILYSPQREICKQPTSHQYIR